MTKPHDDRFSDLGSVPPADPKDYPDGLKPGDPNFFQEFCKKHGIKFTDSTKQVSPHW